MHSLPRKLINSLVCVSLVAPSTLGALAPMANAQENARSFSRSDYQACQTQDEQAFHEAIERITTQALTRGLAHVDYEASVTVQWREIGMDKIIDERVDEAVEEVRQGTSWGTLIKSLAYNEQAQQLATEVADRVYRSKPVTKGIEDLAVGVGNDIGKQIELATHDAAEPALKCLRAFLGPRYGETIAQVVATDAHNEFAMSPGDGGANVTPGTVLRESTGGLTGVAILLVRRQLANLARSLGQRLVGAVLARLVSVVAGGIGLVLIAKDIWDLRHGVLPIIAEEMKSPDTKKKVREELAKGLETQIADHIRQIGAQAADRIVVIWHQFRADHAKTLNLTQSNDNYKRFANETSPERLARLDEVTALVLEREGEAGIAARLSNGSLHEAVARLPDSAMIIARESRSLEDAIKWNALAGPDVDKVAQYGIYRTASPGDFTRSSLTRIMSLNDRIAITHLANVKPQNREVLLELETSQLAPLARSLTSAELSTLSGYLTGLSPAPRKQVLETIAKTPGKMQVLASDRVRSAILSSTDQDAAVTMMLASNGSFDAAATLKNFQLVWNGKVNPILIVDKHPIALIALALLFLVVLLMLKRLFSTARAQKPESRSA